MDQMRKGAGSAGSLLLPRFSASDPVHQGRIEAARTCGRDGLCGMSDRNDCEGGKACIVGDSQDLCGSAHTLLHGVDALSDSTQAELCRLDEDVLDCSTHILLCHIRAGEAFCLQAGNDCKRSMSARLRIRGGRSERLELDLAFDNPEFPGLLVHGRRRCHGSPQKPLYLLLRDRFVCVCPHARAGKYRILCFHVGLSCESTPTLPEAGR